jgi:hypothetical protein
VWRELNPQRDPSLCSPSVNPRCTTRVTFSFLFPAHGYFPSMALLNWSSAPRMESREIWGVLLCPDMTGPRNASSVDGHYKKNMRRLV